MPKPSPLVVSAPMRECRLWSTIPCCVLKSSSSISTGWPSHPIQRHIAPLLVSCHTDCRGAAAAAHHPNRMTSASTLRPRATTAPDCVPTSPRDSVAGVTAVRITHIGGPTALIEVGGWRLLTDPTFDPAGEKYRFGWGTGSRKLAGPAIAASDLGPIDAVLLSHDHHDDNLDPAGRALLPSAGAVITTVAGAGAAGRRGARSRAVADHPARGAGRPTIEITATPCRHGPPLSRPIVGDVIGFALRWDGQEHGVLWISGDTVLYDGVRAGRRAPAGGHRAPAPGRRPLPGHRAAALHDDRPRRGRAVRAGRAAHRHPDPLRGLEALPAGARQRSSASSRRAPEDDPRRRVRWLPIGVPVDIAA